MRRLLAAEVTETLPQALKRDPRTDGSYARLNLDYSRACSGGANGERGWGKRVELVAASSPGGEKFPWRRGRGQAGVEKRALEAHSRLGDARGLTYRTPPESLQPLATAWKAFCQSG